MEKPDGVDMLKLREALEASWGTDTAYLNVEEAGNPALGQCYPTSRVVQHFFPEFEIAVGEVWTGRSTEKHFWNVRQADGNEQLVDFTWQQFPAGSVVKSYKLLDRNDLNDGPEAVKRVELLLARVKTRLNKP